MQRYFRLFVFREKMGNSTGICYLDILVIITIINIYEYEYNIMSSYGQCIAAGYEREQRGMKKRFQNAGLRTKIMAFFLLVALIPLILFSFVLGRQLLRDQRTSEELHARQIVEQVSVSLDTYIGVLDDTMDFLTLAVKEERENGADDVVERELSRLVESHPNIVGAIVAYDDDSFTGVNMRRVSKDPFYDEDWYLEAKDYNGRMRVISSAVGRNVVSNEKYPSDTIFSVARSFWIPGADPVSGVILMDIRHDLIQNQIASAEIGEEGFFFLTDAENEVTYAPENDVVYRIDGESILSAADTSRFIRIGGTDYMITSVFSPITEWHFVGVVPTREYYSGIARTYRGLFICALVAVALVLILGFILANSVTRPLRKLTNLMDKVEEGDFSVRFDSRYDDEIGVLGRHFNSMNDKMDDLVNRLHVEEQSRLEAQLKSLQEQIKPHFLYNTLDTISWLARKYDATEVVDIIDALTNMFRLGLSKGRDYISLKEERSHAANYLYIQKWRYSDKMNYEISIPEKYDDLTVPKLILQPLVENAIYHGIKNKRGGGTIRIFADEKDGWLYLAVEDDGAGIEEEHLRQIRDQLENPEPGSSEIGFGLFYIAKRIRLYYGEGSGVTIDSMEGEFTRVTLVIPIEEKTHG